MSRLLCFARSLSLGLALGLLCLATPLFAQDPATAEPAATQPAGEPAPALPAPEIPAGNETAPKPKADDHGHGDHDHEKGDHGHGEQGVKGDDEHGAGHGGASMGHQMPVWATIPFIVILLAIAVFPLVNEHWWEHNSNKGIVSAVLALPVAAYLLIGYGHDGWHELEHKILEYISFIAMLGALFIISGGIYVKGSLSGTPIVNTLMLALGASIASFVGTTGASMLLIRPLLRANASRANKTHIVVFFIFIVSNCGGLLTPLGDPPLFLGFLSGVPFTWTFRLWQQWLLVNLVLLVVFNIYDQIVLNKEEKERPGSQLEQVQQHEPFGIAGGFNIGLLLAVVAVIYASGQGIGNGGAKWPVGIAEVLLAGIAVISYFRTPKAIHEANHFSFTPINEVAILFAGIFITMTPALLILNANGAKLGVNEPWEFFWASGILSSFLDNAPTYLTFAATACGMQNIPLEGAFLAEFLRREGSEITLAAISCGSVFMGANTYIGNGPNFMVKAIAEQRGVKMPSFFGYMAYSGAILLPVFVLVTLLFFRG
jgi:Na+/H+ antiporter NhaD/arsenite permease-like protein